MFYLIFMSKTMTTAAFVRGKEWVRVAERVEDDRGVRELYVLSPSATWERMPQSMAGLASELVARAKELTGFVDGFGAIDKLPRQQRLEALFAAEERALAALKAR